MTVLLFLSVFWISYGLLGIFGIQNIPKRYRGTELEKAYKRYRGIGWLLLGIPMFVFWLVVHNMEISNRTLFVTALIVLALPSVIYDLAAGRKF